MAQAKEKKKVVILASLYRFGYELRIVSATKDEAETQLMKEYKKAYKKYNDGESPSMDFIRRAMEDIEYTDMEFDTVEWF